MSSRNCLVMVNGDGEGATRQQRVISGRDSERAACSNFRRALSTTLCEQVGLPLDVSELWLADCHVDSADERFLFQRLEQKRGSPCGMTLLAQAWLGVSRNDDRGDANARSA